MQKSCSSKFYSQIIYIISILYINIIFANAKIVKFPYENGSISSDKEIGNVLKQTISSQDGIRSKLMKSFLGDGLAGRSGGALEYIRTIINIALGFISFIALIIMIYGFFMIFFSKEEEGVKNARATVKGSVTAIILIGLSWTIVSLMFWGVSLIRG